MRRVVHRAHLINIVMLGGALRPSLLGRRPTLPHLDGMNKSTLRSATSRSMARVVVLLLTLHLACTTYCHAQEARAEPASTAGRAPGQAGNPKADVPEGL